MPSTHALALLACGLSLAGLVRAQTTTPETTPEPPTAATAATAKVVEAAPAYDPTSINMGFGAILPRNRPYAPLTGDQRFKIWQRDNFMNPPRIVRSLMWSVIDASNNRPPEWGGGASGFGKRAGSRFARSMMSSSVEHGAAAAVGYDVRYISSSSQGKWARLGHSVLYRFVTLDRRGHRVFNFPQLLGTYSSEMIATKWTPGEKWSAQGLQSANQQVAFGIGLNILREFLPDLKRKLKGK